MRRCRSSFPCSAGVARPVRRLRGGKILVLVAVLIPAFFGMAAVVIDGGLLMLLSRKYQHAADAAATAAAYDVALDSGSPSTTADHFVRTINGLPEAEVTLNTPPASGAFAGRAGYVEVLAEESYAPKFAAAGGIGTDFVVRSRSVAGLEAATAEAAVVILDPSPPTVSLGVLPISLPSLTPLLGGLEVLGLGCLRVSGAILINNTWGGVDENGEQIGPPSLLRHAASCTPILPLTRVRASDVRVVGGIDHPASYGPLTASGTPPLRANRRPVPDPYRSLPAPTLSADPVNVSSTLRGGVTVINLPILPPVRLRPGVYDWIQVVTGPVVFDPGVYIIRDVHPITRIGLSILAGPVTAEGVMFYFTNSPGYSPASGTPDGLDGETSPGNTGVLTLLPSALINGALLSSRFSGLNSPGSPFHGMVMYQRRQDRRPILILGLPLLGSSSFSGNVYAKWGSVILGGTGTYRSAFAVGSLRILDVLDCRIEPTNPLPPAYDVFLVE